MNTDWTPLKAKHAPESVRRSLVFSTAAMVAGKSVNRNRREVTRSASNPQRLKDCRGGKTGGTGHHHCAAPADHVRHCGAEETANQDTGRHGSLLDGEYQRRESRRRDPTKQLRAGRGRYGATTAADYRRRAETQKPTLSCCCHSTTKQHQRHLAHA